MHEPVDLLAQQELETLEKELLGGIAGKIARFTFLDVLLLPCCLASACTRVFVFKSIFNKPLIAGVSLVRVKCSQQADLVPRFDVHFRRNGSHCQNTIV